MRKVFALAVGGFVLVGLAWAAEKVAPKVATYSDGTFGFSLNAPCWKGAEKEETIIPVMMAGPLRKEFTSNVNVVVQRITTSRKEYRDRTVKEFQESGFKINSEQNLTVSGKDAILFDYEGNMNGKDLRFLALAVVDTDRVFLTTCTALKSRFQEDEPEFRACLDSFKLAQGEPGEAEPDDKKEPLP